MNRHMFLCVALLAALLVGGCNDSGTGPVSSTETVLSASNAAPKKGTDPIPEILQEEGLDKLLEALEYADDELGAGLGDLFAGNNQHTVFAPTDEAFENLYALLRSVTGLPINGVTDIDPQTVLDILMTHVVPGRRGANSIVPKRNARRITPLAGEPFLVRSDRMIEDALTGNPLRLESPELTTTDISASNGIIHVIDQLVISPKVLDKLLGEPVPVCDVTPMFLDFGTVTVGSTADLDFTISNAGTGTLSGDVSEACDHYSIIAGGGPYDLTNGQSVTVTVQFAPTADGTHACSIETGTECANVEATGVGGDVSPGVTVTATEVGGDVVFEGSGTLNLDVWSVIGTGGGVQGGSRIDPGRGFGIVVVGPTIRQVGLWSIGDPGNFNEKPVGGFGSVLETAATSGSGDVFGFTDNVGTLEVPEGYVSGAPLSGSATYAGATFASLGMVAGTYVWSWGTGQPDESFTLVIGP